MSSRLLAGCISLITLFSFSFQAQAGGDEDLIQSDLVRIYGQMTRGSDQDPVQLWFEFHAVGEECRSLSHIREPLSFWWQDAFIELKEMAPLLRAPGLPGMDRVNAREAWWLTLAALEFHVPDLRNFPCPPGKKFDSDALERELALNQVARALKAVKPSRVDEDNPFGNVVSSVVSDFPTMGRLPASAGAYPAIGEDSTHPNDVLFPGRKDLLLEKLFALTPEKLQNLEVALEYLDLSDSTVKTCATLVECYFRNVNLANTKWTISATQVRFANCSFEWAMWQLADINQTQFMDCTFRQTTFGKASSANGGNCTIAGGQTQHLKFWSADMNAVFFDGLRLSGFIHGNLGTLQFKECVFVDFYVSPSEQSPSFSMALMETPGKGLSLPKAYKTLLPRPDRRGVKFLKSRPLLMLAY